jgi:hypothetical protein
MLNQKVDVTKTNIHDALHKTAQTASLGNDVEILLKGPKIHGKKRTKYESIEGQGDVYWFLLKVIASNPPTLSFEYNELMSRCRFLSKDKSPSMSSLIAAAKQMMMLSSYRGDSSSRLLIEWDNERRVLTLPNPMLLIYLRWTDTLKKV